MMRLAKSLLSVFKPNNAGILTTPEFKKSGGGFVGLFKTELDKAAASSGTKTRKSELANRVDGVAQLLAESLWPTLLQTDKKIPFAAKEAGAGSTAPRDAGEVKALKENGQPVQTTEAVIVKENARPAKKQTTADTVPAALLKPTKPSPSNKIEILQDSKSPEKSLSVKKSVSTLFAAVSESQAVAKIEKVVDSLSQIASNAKVQVHLDVENRGQLAITAERTANKLNLRVAVENSETKEWLTTRLAQTTELDGAKIKTPESKPGLTFGENKSFASEALQKVEINVGLAKIPEVKLNQVFPGGKQTLTDAVQTIKKIVGSTIVRQPGLLSGEYHLRLDIEKIGPVLVQIAGDGEKTVVRLLPETKNGETSISRALFPLVKAMSPAVENPNGAETRASALLDVVLAIEYNKTDSTPAKRVAAAAEIKNLTERLLKDGEVTLPAVNKPAATQQSPPRLDSTFSESKKKVDKHLESPLVSRVNEKTSPATMILSSAKEALRFRADDAPAGFLKGEMTQPVALTNAAALEFGSPPVAAQLVEPQRVERSAMAEMIEKIVEVAEAQARSVGDKIEVQMEVEELGTMTVDAVRRDEQIDLRIRVVGGETRRLLESQLIPLVEQMQKDGIAVGKLEVLLREPFEHKSHQQFSPQEEPSSRRSNGASAGQENAPGFDEPAAETPGASRNFGYNSFEVLV